MASLHVILWEEHAHAIEFSFESHKREHSNLRENHPLWADRTSKLEHSQYTNTSY